MPSPVALISDHTFVVQGVVHMLPPEKHVKHDTLPVLRAPDDDTSPMKAIDSTDLDHLKVQLLRARDRLASARGEQLCLSRLVYKYESNYSSFVSRAT
jgi:hypothetical protein